MSLSLALGILVGDLSGYKLLTSAHAEISNCGGTLTTSTVTLSSGLVNGGITVRDVSVNGEYVAQAVIIDSVQIVDGVAVQTNGALVGGGAPTTGGDPCVGSVVVTPNGALVGGGAPTTGGDEPTTSVSGATVSATGTFVGGELMGDNIVISDGVISGQNLLLSGATIDGGSLDGTISSVTVTPGS